MVGFNQNLFGYETEGFRTKAQAGVGAVASTDGVIFPITLSADAEKTLSDNNVRLQTSELKGNFTLGGTIRGIVAKGKFIPSFGLDINPNNVENSVNEQRKKFDTLMKQIQINENGTINIQAVLDRLDTNKTDAANIKDE